LLNCVISIFLGVKPGGSTKGTTSKGNSRTILSLPIFFSTVALYFFTSLINRFPLKFAYKVLHGRAMDIHVDSEFKRSIMNQVRTEEVKR